jgi:hypothetical protein
MREILDQLARFVVVQNVAKGRHLPSAFQYLSSNLVLLHALADCRQGRSAIRPDAVRTMAVFTALLLEELCTGSTICSGRSACSGPRQACDNAEHCCAQQHSAEHLPHLQPSEPTARFGQTNV